MSRPTIIKPAPPVADRPRCPTCEKPLRPLIASKHLRLDIPGEFRTVEVERDWAGRYAGYGAFCSLRCCEAFANAAHRAGYRIVRGT